jgi:hypothetical protein
MSSSGRAGFITLWPWLARKVCFTPPGMDRQPWRKRMVMSNMVERHGIVLLLLAGFNGESTEDHPVKKPLPQWPDEWRKEIELAWKDAKDTKPFALIVGQRLTPGKLFHQAAMICLKFRGMDYKDEELRNRVTEGVLATYVVNDGEKLRPKMAFALCYVTAHFVLDLVDDEHAQEILDYYQGSLK